MPQGTVVPHRDGDIIVTGPVVEVMNKIRQHYLGCRIEHIEWNTETLSQLTSGSITVSLTNTDKEP